MGELTLGLRLDDWKALLYPSLFMSRRLLYAAVLVYCMQWSNLQIQIVMLKTILFGLYLVHIRPYQTPSSNRIELVNEILTQLSTYCLVIFQVLMPQPAKRYQSGWYLIALIVVMMCFNLIVMIVETVRNLIRRCKLRHKRKRNFKLFQEKLAMRKLVKQHFENHYKKCKTL